MTTPLALSLPWGRLPGCHGPALAMKPARHTGRNPLSKTVATTWNLAGAQARAALAAYEELAFVADTVALFGRPPTDQEQRAWDKAWARKDRALAAARDFKVVSLRELADKATLLSAQDFDHDAGLSAVAADVARLAAQDFVPRPRSGFVIMAGSLRDEP